MDFRLTGANTSQLEELMTNKVIIEITTCTECPDWQTQRYYTADSFENIQEWTCGITNERIGLAEWPDPNPGIPDNCPRKNA